MPLVVWTPTGVTEEKGVRHRFRFARVFLGWTVWNRDGQTSTSSPAVLVRNGTWSVPLRGGLFFPFRFLSFVFLVPFVSDLRSFLRKTTYRLRCVVRATRSLDAHWGDGGEGSPAPVPVRPSVSRVDRLEPGRTNFHFVPRRSCSERNLVGSAPRGSVFSLPFSFFCFPCSVCF